MMSDRTHGIHVDPNSVAPRVAPMRLDTHVFTLDRCAQSSVWGAQQAPFDRDTEEFSNG